MDLPRFRLRDALVAIAIIAVILAIAPRFIILVAILVLIPMTAIILPGLIFTYIIDRVFGPMGEFAFVAIWLVMIVVGVTLGLMLPLLSVS